jgi:FkbM family methyltransferase
MIEVKKNERAKTLKSKFIKFLSYSLRKKIYVIFFITKHLIKKVTKDLIKKVVMLILTFFARPFINTRIGREAFFQATPSKQLLLAHTTDDIYYIVNSSDKVIGRSVYSYKDSDAQNLTDALNLISSPKSILLDVGANIGTIGIFGVSRGYFDKCIAFEPEPHNFKILTHNVHLNGLNDKFDLRNEALSSEAVGTLDFELSEENYGDHRIRIKTTSGIYNEANRKVISVAVNTLDRALENVNLDECMLFMDTQGYEGHVLSGANQLIQMGVPVVAEFWPYALKRSGGLELFYNVLSNSGYTSIWDLENPAKKLQFSINELKVIASRIGDGGGFTDLLFMKE